MLEKKYDLMLPGPVTVEDSLLQIMCRPIVTHLHEDWAAFYNSLKIGRAHV